VAARHVKSNLAVLTILIASLLLLANAVPASGADPTPPPCKTAGEFDPANFPNPPKIDNQWNPLVPGMQFVLAGEAKGGEGLLPHRVVSTVTDLIKVVNGVPAVVILEADINQGVLVKSELTYQAQDNAGNLWNLGEFPAEFDDSGNFERAPDAWISGLSDAEPGNLMLGNPQLGTPEYLQGWSPDIDFLNCAKVYKMQQKTCVPVGCYDNVLITEERSVLEPESGHQRKYYAPGVGTVRVTAVGDTEDETLVLAEVSQLSSEDLEKVRNEALELEKTAYKVSDLYRQTQPVESTRRNTTDNKDKSTSTDDGLAWVPFGPKDPTFPTPTWPTYNSFAEGKCSKLRDYLTTDGAGIAQSDLARAMVAVCAAAIEGQQDQWSVAEAHAGADLSGIHDDCLGAAVKELLDRALAWHKQHPGRTPVVQIQRVEGRTECGKRYPPDEPPPTSEGPPPTSEAPPPTSEAPPPTSEAPPPTSEAPPPTSEGPPPTSDEPTETTG
jgi:hypothetical protein